MKEEKFSAFIDNELNESEFNDMCSDTCSAMDPTFDSTFASKGELKGKWQRYHLISDALQKHLPRAVDSKLADRVMQQLENEPAYLLPQVTQTSQIRPDQDSSSYAFPVFKQLAGLAVAASVMAVAVFVTQSFTGIDDVSAPIATAPVDVNVPANVLTAKAPPAMPTQQQFARISGFQTESREPLSPRFQNQLNKYLANHSQYATGAPGVMPYARIIGYKQDQQSGDK